MKKESEVELELSVGRPMFNLGLGHRMGHSVVGVGSGKGWATKGVKCELCLKDPQNPYDDGGYGYIGRDIQEGRLPASLRIPLKSAIRRVLSCKKSQGYRSV
jgi:hypothetical protein